MASESRLKIEINTIPHPYKSMKMVPEWYKKTEVRILVRTEWGPGIATWDDQKYHKNPRPFWKIAGYSTSDARNHPPLMWMDIP